MGKKPKRLDKAVKQATESGEIGRKPKIRKGYSKYAVGIYNWMYIDQSQRKALLHMPDNENGMGGTTLHLKMSDGSEQDVTGAWFHPYEEALELVGLKDLK